MTAAKLAAPARNAALCSHLFAQELWLHGRLLSCLSVFP